MPDQYGATDNDNLQWDAKRRRISTERDQTLAANAYGRFASQQRFGRQREGNTINWQGNRNRLSSPFLQRNISNKSGIWQRALRNFAQKRALAENEFDAGEYDALRGFDMNDANVRQSSADALLALEEERQQMIRNALAGLQGAQQFGVR
jgi:hypothetical protein